MAEEVLIKIDLEGDDNDKKIDQLTKSIVDLNKANKDLIARQKELSKAGQENSKEYLENAKQIELNKQKITEANQARKGLIQTITAEDSAIKRLKIRNAELIRQRDQINTATDEGRKKIAALNREIDENNTTIKENSSALEQQKSNVGNYAESIKEAIGDTNAAGVSLEGLGSKITALANPITAAIALLGGLTAAYAKSSAGSRDLEFAQNRLSSAFGIVIEDLGRLIGGPDGGGGKGLFSQLLSFTGEYYKAIINISTYGLFSDYLDEIAEKSNEAAIAQQRLKDLSISAAFAQGDAKDAEREAELRRRIRDDETKSFEERIKASSEIDKIMEASAVRTVTVLQAQIQAIKESTVSYDNNREAQLEVAQLEAEIADKQEEITGKLTENVTARQNLIKEIQAEKEAQAALNLEVERYIQNFEKQLTADADRLEAERQAQQQRTDLANQFLDQQGINTERSINFAEREAQNAAKAEKQKQDAYRKSFALKEQLQQEDIENSRRTTDALLGLAQGAFGESQDVAAAGAAISTYRAAAAALEPPPIGAGPVFGPLLATLTIIRGLLQVARIKGVQFARGGIAESGGVLNGPSHSGGGIPFTVSGNSGFEAEGGEAIINKRSTRMFKPILSAINQAGGGVAFAGGGTIPTRYQQGSVISAQTTQSASIAAESATRAQGLVQSIMDNLPPIIVTVEDINARNSEVQLTTQRAVVV